MNIRISRALFLFLLLVSGALLNGCATSADSKNESARPWNAPRNWEHGFPTGIYEQR